MPGLRFLPPVVVVALAGLVLLGCRAQPGSWVEAHNQTTVPIVLVEEYDHSEWLVEACSAREFNLTGADIPTKPGQIPVGALRFPISLVGPASPREADPKSASPRTPNARIASRFSPKI